MISTPYKVIKKRSQDLRRNMTKEERRLWYNFLTGLSITVHRQHRIGHYITDFYIASKKIVIELDGSQHFDDKGKQYDEIRNDYLISRGYKVLRYTNTDIMCRFESVCQDIYNAINDNKFSDTIAFESNVALLRPHPSPSKLGDTFPVNGEGTAASPPTAAQSNSAT